MTTAQVNKMILNARLKDNAGMIRVLRHHADGTVSVVHRTFRTDSIPRFLRKKTGKFSVSQD